jgi:hypothetical protein
VRDAFELTKGVLVFKNVLKDPQRTYEIIKKSQIEKHELFTDWVDWGISGYKSTLDTFEKRDLDNEPGEIIKELSDVYTKCLTYYKNNYLDMEYLKSLDVAPNYNIPTTQEELEVTITDGWGPADILLVDYANSYGEDGFINGYHIDRTPFWGSTPHAFTINVYPYDDFEGGGLAFIDMETAERKITDNGVEYYEIDKPVEYFPEAGDAMLFSSLHYHGVYGTKNGEKVFIRMYVESPMPNAYKKEIEFMTQDQINAKRDIARKECFASNSHQANIYNSVEEISNIQKLNKKFIVRNKAVD